MIQPDEQVISGTTYKKATPKEVIALLEDSRINRKRLLITYGNSVTGEPWGDVVRGHVGRSTGDWKIPILIKTKRSLGGEAILDDCIVKIQESKGGKILWQWKSK